MWSTFRIGVPPTNSSGLDTFENPEVQDSKPPLKRALGILLNRSRGPTLLARIDMDAPRYSVKLRAVRVLGRPSRPSSDRY